MLETHLFGALHVLGKHNGIVVVCPRFPPLSFRLLAPEAGSTRTCAHMPLKPWQGEAGPAWGTGEARATGALLVGTAVKAREVAPPATLAHQSGEPWRSRPEGRPRQECRPSSCRGTLALKLHPEGISCTRGVAHEAVLKKVWRLLESAAPSTKLLLLTVGALTRNCFFHRPIEILGSF